jgi:hypothetical protein
VILRNDMSDSSLILDSLAHPSLLANKIHRGLCFVTRDARERCNHLSIQNLLKVKKMAGGITLQAQQNDEV